MTYVRRVLERCAVPALLVGFWSWMTTTNDNLYFPSPARIWGSIANWATAGLDHDVLASLATLMGGYLVAVIGGVGVGLIIGRSRWLSWILLPTISFLRTLPGPAMLPFYLLILGIGAPLKVAVVAGSIWSILLNTVDGVQGQEPRWKDVALCMGLSRWAHIRKIVVPGAAPQILAGMRDALAVSIVLIVFSEMYASTDGIGHFVLYSQRTFDFPRMWAGILIFGIMGYVLSLASYRIESQVMKKWGLSGHEDA